MDNNPVQLDGDAPAIVPPAPPKPDVKVTDAHKEAFFKAFLSDTPYEEEFQLLGGHYKITLRAMTMAENAALLTQIAFDRDKGRIEGVNDYYFSRVAHYRLGLSLVRTNDIPFAVDIHAGLIPTDKETGTSFVSRRADLFAAWPMTKMAALQAALQEFDQRMLVLIDAVADPDFWKAAA